MPAPKKIEQIDAIFGQLKEINPEADSRDDTLRFLSHDMRAPQASILALLELQGRRERLDGRASGHVFHYHVALVRMAALSEREEPSDIRSARPISRVQIEPESP